MKSSMTQARPSSLSSNSPRLLPWQIMVSSSMLWSAWLSEERIHLFRCDMSCREQKSTDVTIGVQSGNDRETCSRDSRRRAQISVPRRSLCVFVRLGLLINNNTVEKKKNTGKHDNSLISRESGLSFTMSPTWLRTTQYTHKKKNSSMELTVI